MSGLEVTLRAVNVFFAGLIVGALVVMQASIAPIIREWPPRLAVKLHQEIIRFNPDRYIIPSGAISLVAGVLALVFADDLPGVSLVLTVVGLALMVAVAVISEVLNQPINRAIGKTPADGVPDEYEPMRARWLQAHLWRTAVGVGGLACYIVGALKAA
jgi:Domain of unknown function (DUF1772)